jgi:hypothetical protein
MNAAMHTSREPPLAARERKHLPMAENPGRPLEQQRSQRSKSPQITPHLSNAIARSRTDATKRARNRPGFAGPPAEPATQTPVDSTRGKLEFGAPQAAPPRTHALIYFLRKNPQGF